MNLKPDWTGISDRAWNTDDAGPIVRLWGSLTVGGVAGRSPSARIAIVLSVGGERLESVRYSPRARYPKISGAIDWVRLRRGRDLSAVPFGRELWAARFAALSRSIRLLGTRLIRKLASFSVREHTWRGIYLRSISTSSLL